MNPPPKALFMAILRTARQNGASDAHLIAGLPPALRVGGEIIMVSNCAPLTADDLNGMANQILDEKNKARFEEEREISVSVYDEENGRIRLSLYHRVGVPEMAIRMVNLEVRSSEDLMLPSVIDDLARLTSGLVLITGPTGMGKTTTLNYMIDLINRTRRAKIITIEDPIEFEHRHRRSIVTQIEVGTDTLDFAHCLRHVLRLDPDVICVGEMRDLDTMQTALTAAETGHFVIATLHTPNAVSTVERIVSSFDGPRQPQVIYQLSSTLQGVVAQRLLPTVDKSRLVLATEVLLANVAVRSIIRENRLHQLRNAIATSAADEPMHDLEDSLADLYRKGLITYDQAMANAGDRNALKSLLETRKSV